jgi:hypothetical protein
LAKPERRNIESAKYVVEHAIHFAVQRKEWMHVGSVLEPTSRPLLCVTRSWGGLLGAKREVSNFARD